MCKVVLNLIPNIDDRPIKDPELFKSLDTPLAKPEVDEEQKERERYFPPIVIVPLSNVRISEREPFILQCKIDGYPKPKVSFVLD